LNLTSVLLDLFAPGDCVFDVGAFRGELAQKLAAKAGVVHAFEPHPAHYLDLSFRAGNLASGNVLPYSKAIGERKGHTTFFSGVDFLNSDTNQSSTMLKDLASPERLGEDMVALKVELDTLDSICFGQHLVPQLIKIDVEGAEGQVVAGAKDVFKMLRPITVFECGWSNGKLAHLFTLEEMGYTLFVVDIMYYQGKWLDDSLDTPTPLRITPADHANITQSLLVNIAAVPNERMKEARFSSWSAVPSVSDYLARLA
jgi:FkbM family methyltransferase